jgi:putative endonuclease
VSGRHGRAPAAKKRRAQRFGRWAEAVAAWWLRAKGYRVLAHGHRDPVGEIDLIAAKGGQVVFVEVKARGDLDAARHAVSLAQRRRIQRAAEGYLARHPALAGRAMRFDAVLIAPWTWPVHLVDAWRP